MRKFEKPEGTVEHDKLFHWGNALTALKRGAPVILLVLALYAFTEFGTPPSQR